MRKISTLVLGLCALFLSLSSSAAIYGTLGVCVGNSSTLYDSSSTFVPGGTWSSSNVAVASVTSGGVVTGHSAGTCNIAYATATYTSTATFTVSPLPTAITGATMFCAGSSITLSCSTPGGVWSSSSPAAWVASTTGVVTGVSFGTATITYTIATGCSTTAVVTVNATSVDSVLGPSTICVGGTGTLTCVTPGGTWSSSSTAVATVSGSGVVTGVSAGSVLITYSVAGPCGGGYQTHWVMVSGSTSPGTISGVSALAVGFTGTMSSTVGGGTWSSSNTAIATVSSSGVVTGVAPGTAVISYAVSGCSGIAYATATVTISAADCISGDVLFSGAPYTSTVKVWLIKYNSSTHMLYAVDSTNVYASGSTAHYSFCGMGTDSFRVKAACTDTMTMSSTTGYQPTYHTASAYWSAATVIYHVSGTHDMSKNINMNYGTVTSGPGFIAGDVTTGANKGTADPIPAVGLLVYCVNSTGAILQQTKTDAAGHYSFSSLPVGTYKIYPELINYVTTPYTSITLTSGSSSMTAAHFVQHTLSHTITPGTTAVQDITVANIGMSIYPNPTSGIINISWDATNAGMANVQVSDVTGRNVYTSSVDMGTNAGTANLNLGGIAKGIYMISVKANGVNYNSKIVVE